MMSNTTHQLLFVFHSESAWLKSADTHSCLRGLFKSYIILADKGELISELLLIYLTAVDLHRSLM